MKKVICTNNKSSSKSSPLTIGKMYQVINETYVPFSPSRYDDPSGPFYKIKCDTGEVRHFEADNFRDLTTDEKRELKLEDLGL